MVRLEVRDLEDRVSQAFNLDVAPGATVAISGFHGSRIYEVTEFDKTLVVRFTGVNSVESAPEEVKVEKLKTEDGVEESDAEAMNRTLAEEDAKRNDEKAKKEEKGQKSEAPAAKPSGTTEKK